MRATGAEELQEEILLKKAESRIGATLRDKWRLDSLIGFGGMGAVYRATHRNGMRGAVKLLHPERAADHDIRQRFLREGYLANKVGHEGAVRILDDDEADGTVFLVMELLEGMTLEERANRAGGILDTDETMLAMDQLLETLAAAHDKGIIHRDIKPANLFLTTSGLVKILDYGIAGLNEPTSEARTATQTGVGMGTPAFMAPEQARGRWTEVDAQSDLWSLGATMFSLLSGTTVHDEGTVQEQIAATFLVPARAIHTVAPGLPLSLAAVIDRSLRLDKKERWRDARAMRRALRTAYEQIHNRPMPSLASPSVVAPRPSSSPAALSRSSTPPAARLSPTPRPPRLTPTPPLPRLATPVTTPRSAASSASPLRPSKSTLAGTESPPGPAPPPRRRAVVVIGVVCALAAVAFFIGFTREASPRRDAPAIPSGSVASVPEPSSVVASAAPPSSASAVAPPAPSSSAPIAGLVPSASAARPAARHHGADAGKNGTKSKPREDSIF